MAQSVLAIGESSIRQLDGLYSLNDLHTAAGAEAKHQPGFFLRRKATRNLIEAIGASANPQSPLRTVNDGSNNGTYACRELVIAYAAWISAAFHLKVIRVFLAQQQQANPITSLLNRRWLGSFDEHGREQIRFIDWDDCLIKYPNLPTLIKDPGNVLRAELLAAIVQACFERLHSNTKNMAETIQLLRKALDMKNGAVAQPRKAT